MNKTKVEALLRKRGFTDTVIWRDNRKSTYAQVYEYLMKHPNYKIETTTGTKK